jgi:general secretion pathway protein A
MYESFFSLAEMPFNITPDPRFLYFSPRHREAFSHLIYGITHRRGFIELVGEVGSGKTTLCRAVLGHLPETVQTALILNPSLSATQLLRAILNDLGLVPKGRDRLAYIEQLNAYLLEMTRDGKNVALFIDEAQNLLPEVMEQVRLLSNLETDQHKLLQIVLAGQPELEDRLNQRELRQLRQRITVRCTLAALDEREVGEYIAHRLRVAGAPTDVGFEPDAVRLVFKHSQGTPRVINTISDRSLLAAYVEQSRVVKPAHVKRAWQEVAA